ncbi:MAG TPA: tetratricopeptide repeat protein [Steroidobacteraceae bacterium]
MPYDSGIPLVTRRPPPPKVAGHVVQVCRSVPAALALLIWIASQYSGTVDAADDFSNQGYQDQIRISVNTKNCFDAKRPPSERISSCTMVIEQGNVGKTNTAKLYVARGTVLNDLGKHDEAIADFTHAIALDPHDQIAYSNRAAEYLTSSRFELAVADLTEVIRADPANGMAFYNRATAYERSGERNKALEDYRNAARLLPSFAAANAALGRLLKASNPDAALSELSAAIQQDPKSPALRSRAILYLSLGRFEQALRDFNQVIASNSSDSIAFLDRGVTNDKIGNMDGAISDYGRSIALVPSVIAYVDRGGAYSRLQQPERALADFDAALKIDSNNLDALLGRANAHYARKELDASLNDYTRVIGADPKNAVAYFKRGNIHLDSLEFAQACSDYTASLKLDPNQPVTLYNKAIAETRLGRLQDAAEDRRRALALDPSLASEDEPQRQQ